MSEPICCRCKRKESELGKINAPDHPYHGVKDNYLQWLGGVFVYASKDSDDQICWDCIHKEVMGNCAFGMKTGEPKWETA